MTWPINKLFGKRAHMRDAPKHDPAAPPVPTRPGKADWERVLAEPIEQSCDAPSDDAIVHAFDLYRDPIYAPFLERQHQMAELRTEIGGIAAALNARVPHLIERVMSSHPFEFAHILEQRELHR